MARATENVNKVAGYLLLTYLIAWVDQAESYPKPEFMLTSEFTPEHQKVGKEGRSSAGNDEGIYSPHLSNQYPPAPLPPQHQTVLMDSAPPPIPSQYSPNSDYLGGGPPLLIPFGYYQQPISSDPIHQTFGSSVPTYPDVDLGMHLDVRGILLIISDKDAQGRCPYQGFHPLGSLSHQNTYLVCIPWENNIFIGIQAACPNGQLFSPSTRQCGHVSPLQSSVMMGRASEAEDSILEAEPQVQMEVLEESFTAEEVWGTGDILEDDIGLIFERVKNVEEVFQESPVRTLLQETEHLDDESEVENFLNQLFLEAEMERNLEQAGKVEVEAEREESVQPLDKTELSEGLEQLEEVVGEDVEEEFEKPTELVEDVQQVVETEEEAEAPVVQVEDDL